MAGDDPGASTIAVILDAVQRAWGAVTGSLKSVVGGVTDIVKTGMFFRWRKQMMQNSGGKLLHGLTSLPLEAWFPLGGKGDCRTLFADPVIAEVASNHGVSPAQVLIRWHLQNNNVCIAGSSNPEHIREDADVFGFSLTPDEMAAIDGLDRNHRFASY